MTAPVRAPERPARRSSAPATRPEAPHRPHLTVVAPAPRRSRAGLRAAVTLVVVFLALFLNAVCHTVLVSGQQQLDSLNREVEASQQRNQRLRLEVAGLESPNRIVAAASRAGMVVPDQTHWLSARPDGSAIGSTSRRPTPSLPAAGEDLAEQAAGTGDPEGR